MPSMTPTDVPEPSVHNKCSTCSLSKICIPDHLSGAGLEELEQVLESSTLYQNGETMFSAGQHFDRIYAVKSGMVKTVRLDPDGKEFIDGFHLPGEVFALDAIYPGKYLSTACSIGTSAVCSIEFATLEHLASHLPRLQHQIFELLSKAVHKSHEIQIDLSAEQKLAGFILNLSQRFKMRGYSDTRMNLIMPRRDIANHLNMVPETISRLFKALQQSGIISIDRTDLAILNPSKLTAIAAGDHSVRRTNSNDHEDAVKSA